MAEPRTCLECGSPLQDEFAGGLCPRCLMGLGVAASDAETLNESEPEPVSRGSRRSPRFSDGDDLGHFRIVRLLGQGGMGEVYEAEDLDSGRRVAIKVMAHTLASDEHRERFLREGRLAASINHPNSVYVFGTEEIDGIPVISMELSPGGTLQDSVQDGRRMVPVAAVDAALDLIEGLQAALDKGILHRDIKPSNCFVEADGRVKVGDYGLSISTRSDETVLTAAGTMLGTPGYASPEQLQAGDLDVRSDIYSLGATLYCLLTARPPFEETRVANLMAAILERTPTPPHELRPLVPKALSRVVLRCLSRDPANRFDSYRELREGLLPFSSARSEPAALRVRALAYALDYGLLTIVSSLALLLRGTNIQAEAFVMLGPGLQLLYFPLFEGVAGHTPGKWVCGIRVIGKAGPPGVAAAALRWMIFYLAPGAVFIGVGWPFVESLLLPAIIESSIGLLLNLALLSALFVTARRHNGFAGLHDIISVTHVVGRGGGQARASIEPDRTELRPEEGYPQVGPYKVTGFLVHTESEEVLDGYDPTLGRRVWIRKVPEGTPPVSPRRRDLARPGRFRWLNGRRRPGENWDAYAGVDGQPFEAAAHVEPPWSSVRFWLLDLAAEVSEGASGHTRPEKLTSDRIWIGTDGRARWLDFSVSDRCPQRAGAANRNGVLADLQTVLFEIASTASPHGKTPPLPLTGSGCVQRLKQAGFHSLSELLSSLRSLTAGDPAVSRERRLAQVLLCAAFPVLSTIFFSSMFYFTQQPTRDYPEWARLDQLLLQAEVLRTRQSETNGGGDLVNELEVYIAGHYRMVIEDPGFWPPRMSERRRERFRAAQKLVDRHPAVTVPELQAAESRIEPLLISVDNALEVRANLPLFAAFLFATLAGLGGLVSTALFRGGLLMGSFGVAVVVRSGRPAPFWRVLLRGVLVWGTVLLLFPGGWARLLTLNVFGSIEALQGLSVAVTSYGFLGMAPSAFLIASAAAWAVLHPSRGLQDRLAGTYLVPR